MTITHYFPSKRTVLSIALLLASGSSYAGEISVETLSLDEGNVTAMLEASSQLGMDAMRNLIENRHTGTYMARRWETVESHMRDTPVARFEYRFQKEGKLNIKVYHALGGKPLGMVAHDALEGDSPLRTPDTPDSDFDWSEESEARFQATKPSDFELNAAEEADEAFYTGFDDLEVRAPFRSPAQSVMEAYWHEGRYHALDPEYKALRAIEEDLRRGLVARGGEIRGMVSVGSCPACQTSARSLAAAYDVDTRITQIFGSVPTAQHQALLASGSARMKGLKLVDAVTDKSLLASDVLAEARAVQVRRSLHPAALDRVLKGWSWSGFPFQLAPPRLPRISETSNASDEAQAALPDKPTIPPEC